MTTHWQEHDLDEVIRYFANGFEPRDGKRVVRYEFYIDTYSRKVVFQLFLEPIKEKDKP